MKGKFIRYIILGLMVCVEGGFISQVYAQPAEIKEKEYELRMPDSSFLEKIRKDKAFDYTESDVNHNGLLHWLERLQKFLPSFQWSDNSRILFLLVKIGAVLLLLLAVYWILKGGIISPFGRKAKVFSEKEDGVELPENVDEDSYRTLLEKALRKDDYVLAVRLQFLYLLHWLDEKNLIQWKSYKTNADYIRELKDKEQSRQFRHLSYIFDCVCYGKFEINEALYRKAEAEFSVFRKEAEA